jgi:hypothetical protein
MRKDALVLVVSFLGAVSWLAIIPARAGAG